MARQTSIMSYIDLDYSRKQLLYTAITQILKANPEGLTDKELCKIVPKFLQSLQPRVRRNELYNKGIVIADGVRKDVETGKTVKVWKLKESVR